jgi:putative DNA-invertase from lambdoid prophage Rac
MGVRVHCLALGGVDLTSSAGRMTMGVINSVAQFERDLLIERTQSGLKRAKAGGEVFGRPPTLTEAQRAAVREQIAAGTSVSALAKRYGTSRQTVMRAETPPSDMSLPRSSNLQRLLTQWRSSLSYRGQIEIFGSVARNSDA